MISDGPPVPTTPPKLLPGRSANAWGRLGLLAGLLMFLGFGGIGLIVGFTPTQAGRDALAPWWAAATVGGLALFEVVQFRFRRACYRERAAGYTTLFGSRASWFPVPTRGASLTLFSTIPLWQLNMKTGAVLRPPRRDPAAFRLRIPMDWVEHGSTATTWYVEFKADGGVLRQIGLDRDNEVIYRCGPEEFGVWNDAIKPAFAYTPESLRAAYPGTTDVDADSFEFCWRDGSGILGRWPNQRSPWGRIVPRLRR